MKELQAPSDRGEDSAASTYSALEGPRPPLQKEADNETMRQAAPSGEIRVSVRGLVEFVLRQGDIDSRRQSAPDNAMQEGGRIHRMLQRRMGAEYQAEVPLKYALPAGEYVLVVEGRADGIIRRGEMTVIDEIKGTYRELSRLKAPLPLHLAQAKCYGYLYGRGKELTQIQVRLTYCHIPTEELRYFHQTYEFAELEEWFSSLLASYRRWSDHIWEWRKARQASIRGLAFPFPYREGQQELVAQVYRTIYHGRKLYLEAPTGAGKTIAAIYPAVQAIGQGIGDRLFYLTAKTITRTVAENTLALLRQKGLRFKSVILTAKEKICFLEEPRCSPEECPYAKGHFDRINDAMYDLLIHQESFGREQIEACAQKHRVCPFELNLDMSLFADGVICDYNYLFDPHVYLKRFFAGNGSGNHLFLIDEAHNLLERGREMYSASLWKEQFVEMRREIKKTQVSETGKHSIAGQIAMETASVSTQLSHTLAEIDRDGTALRRRLSSRKGRVEKILYHLQRCNREMLALKRQCAQSREVERIDSFVQALTRLHAALDEYFSEPEEKPLGAGETLLEFYFAVSHFLSIYEIKDENYITYTQMEEDGKFLLKLFCVNPRENLKGCLEKGRSAILFSATFLPIQYYKRLLGGQPQDYEVYAGTVFDPGRRGVFVARDVTSKYTRRSEQEYQNIARYIEEIVKNRHGNYMVFCPSYAFMREIYRQYLTLRGQAQRDCILQSECMGEEEREAFLARFQEREDQGAAGEKERTLIGFCVLGGIFAEGIDLKNDSLIGAVIVGTGLPQVCFERELIKEYFDGAGEDGFDYAYRFPGMNKVLQAAGRVIRTVEDVGIVALLDQRFLQPDYGKLFPREWEGYETVTVDTVAGRVERFWDSWL